MRTNSNLIRVLLFVCVVSLLMTSSLTAQEIKTMNINTATAQELTELQKVGPKIADRIIEYRTANGPFKKTEDIMNVKGIGGSIYELNKDRIIVEDANEKPEQPNASETKQQ